MDAYLIFGEMNWIEKQFSKLLIGLFSGLHEFLSNQGVQIENFFEQYGEDTSILAFNLDTGNVYGVFAAKIYVACISIMVLLVGLIYMYQIMRTTVSPNPNKIALVKENITGLAIGILLVGFAPYIVDALIRIRTLLIATITGWLGAGSGGDAAYSLYLSGAKESVLGSFILGAYVGASFYLSFVYISLALMQTFYFAFFPVIALRGMLNRKLLLDWVKTFVLWMLIPMVDMVLLALPITIINQERNLFLGVVVLISFLGMRGFVYNKLGVELGPSDDIAHKAFSTATGSVKAIASTVGKGIGAIGGRVSDIASDSREAKKHEELSQIDEAKAEEENSRSGPDGHGFGGADNEPASGNENDKESNNDGNGSDDDGKGTDSNGNGTTDDSGAGDSSDSGGSTNTEEENGVRINDLDDESKEPPKDDKSVPESVSEDSNTITVPVDEDNGEKLSEDNNTPSERNDDKPGNKPAGIVADGSDETTDGINKNKDFHNNTQVESSGEKQRAKDADGWEEARKAVLRRYVNADNFDKGENKKVLSNEELAKMYRARARKKMMKTGFDAVRAVGSTAGTIAGGAFGAMVGHGHETADLGRAIVDSGHEAVDGLYNAFRVPYDNGVIDGKRDVDMAHIANAVNTSMEDYDNGGPVNAPPRNVPPMDTSPVGAPPKEAELVNILELDDYLSQIDPNNSSYVNKNHDDFVVFEKSKGVDRDSLYNIKQEPGENVQAYEMRMNAVQNRTLERGREALRQVDYGNGKVLTGIDALRYVYGATVPSYKPEHDCLFGPTVTHREGQSVLSCEQLGELLYFGKEGKEKEALFKEACESAQMNISFDESGNMNIVPFSQEQNEKYGAMFNDIFSKTGAIARCQEAATNYINGGGKGIYDPIMLKDKYATRSYDVMAAKNRPLTQAEQQEVKAIDQLMGGNNTNDGGGATP